nr:reverse transcriptase domain-containing protein [Tanacetum cinerariifolium]
APSGSKKPNGSSHRTPHWLQWRNHMANETNIVADKNMGCGVFHLYMDEFCDVRSPSPYNGIIGRPGVRKIQAVSSTAHEMLKFLVPRGILTLRSSKIIILECTMVSGPEARPSDIIQHEIIREMEETFQTSREINMKLNPKKCTFGIEEGMFLGYKVNTKGIMAAFKEMKKQIAEIPTLTAPIEKEELIIYLTATREVVSTVLMTKREAKQMPVYFVSSAMQGLEMYYTSLEKLVLALVHASKRLKRWFRSWSDTYKSERSIIHLRPEIQVNGSCMAKEPGMIQYLEKVKTLSSSFKKILNQAELKENSINEAKVLAVMEEDGDKWMIPIYKYLTEETLPAEKEKSRVVRRKSGRNNDASHAKDSGKLSPKWEGPYKVTEELGNEAYKLIDRSGKLLSRTWNIRNLKKCYAHEM